MPVKNFFTDEEKNAIEKIFDRIIPGSSDGGPSASDCDAAHFLDKLLARSSSFHPEIVAWRSLYRSGLESLKEAAVDSFGAPVEKLEDQQVVELLSKLQVGAVAKWNGSTNQEAFFNALRRHCIQGCFADPRWGGNADNAMWDWFGYQTPGNGP